MFSGHRRARLTRRGFLKASTIGAGLAVCTPLLRGNRVDASAEWREQSSLDKSPTQDAIAQGNQPSDMVLTPDASRLYVAAMGTHNVFAIDTKTHQIVDVIDLWQGSFRGDWPFRLAITPDAARIYVANMMSDNLSVIDTEQNELIDSIPLGHFAHDVTVAGDGQWVYVDIGSDRVPVVSTETNEVMSTVYLQSGDRSFTLSSSHDGSSVYVASQAGGGRIYDIDVASQFVFGQFDLHRELTIQGILTVSPDDQRVYLPCGIHGASYERPAEGANRIYIIDPTRQQVAGEIEVIGGPIAMRTSPDGQLGYVSTFAASKVFVVDLMANEVVDEIAWDGILSGHEEWRRFDLRDLAVSPDGSSLYVTGWDADAVLTADATERRMTEAVELNSIEAQLYGMAMTPDGQRLYVSSEAVAPTGHSRLLVIDTERRALTDEIIRDPYPSSPTISEDGQAMYVVSGNQVGVINLDTNRIDHWIDLGHSGGFFYDICLIPGRDAAYVTNVRQEYLYVVDLKDGTVSKRIDVGWWPQMVTVTPDGDKAYVSRQNNPHDAGGLVVLNASTDNVLGEIAPPPGTHGAFGRLDLLAVLPDERHLYWNVEPSRVQVVDTQHDQIVGEIDLFAPNEDERHRNVYATRGIAPHDVAFSRDGSRAYLACGDAFYVAIVDPDTRAIIDRIIDVGMEPTSIEISPDDRFAYTANKESESISVIDLEEHRVIKEISTRS